MSQWESGDREPTLAVIVQLAEFFGVPLSAFVEEAPKPRRWPKRK